MVRNVNQNRKKKNQWLLRFEQLMALIAFLNLGLVAIDITYIPFRDFYLREFRLFSQGLNYIPKSDIIKKIKNQTPLDLVYIYNQIPESFLENAPLLAQGYDYVKGIEPHPETQEYLATVDQFQKQVDETGLNSEPTQQLLQELRQQSTALIEQNPFEDFEQTDTFKTIQTRIENRVANANSAEEAFQIFWTTDYLSNQYQSKIQFFDYKIATLIETNYRRNINPETGEFVDLFWYLDFPFMILFAAEFSVRTYLIHRRHLGLRWIDGMMWRWYDVFLFVPAFRWLRIIPVTIRVDQSGLIKLDSVKKQISQGFVASIAQELTEVIFVRIINQLQSAIRQGELKNIFSQIDQSDYIDLNKTNEVAELSKLLVNLMVYQVLPQIRPDIEALAQYNLVKVFDTSPAFQNLRKMPGVERFETPFTQQIVTLLYQAVYDGIVVALEEDPEGEKLIEQLTTHLTQALSDEMQGKQTLETIQWLLVDFLEEIKINYVQSLSEEDVDELLEQTRRLRDLPSKE